MQLLAQTNGSLGVGDLSRYSLQVTWPIPYFPGPERRRVVVQVSNTTPVYKNLAVQSGPFALSATVETRRVRSNHHFETPLSGSSATSSPQSTPPNSIGRSGARIQSTPPKVPCRTNSALRSTSPASSHGSSRSYQRLKRRLKRFTRLPHPTSIASSSRSDQFTTAHTAMIIIGGQSWKAAFALSPAEQPDALFDIEIVSEVNHINTQVQYTLKVWLDCRTVEPTEAHMASNRPMPTPAPNDSFSQRWRHWVDTVAATPAFSGLGRSLWVTPNSDANQQPQRLGHRGRGRSISDPHIAVTYCKATAEAPRIRDRRHSDHGDQLWLTGTASRRAHGSECPGGWLYSGHPAIDFADDGHDDNVSNHGVTAANAVRGTLVLTHTTASVFENAAWRSDPDAWTGLNRPAHLVVLSHGLMGSRLDELYLYEAIQRRYDSDEIGCNDGMPNPTAMAPEPISQCDPSTGTFHKDDVRSSGRKLPTTSAVRILSPSCNHGRTSDGIDVCGLRSAQAILEAVQWQTHRAHYQQVANHVVDVLQRISSESSPGSANEKTECELPASQPTCATEASSNVRHRISFIGHSLGGLTNLNCLYHLDRLTNGQFFLAFEPVHFVTLATPYLGIAENYSVINQACRWGVMGQTGKELAYLHTHNPFKRMLHFDEMLVSTAATADANAPTKAEGPTQRRSACLARVQHELSQLESESSSDASDTDEPSSAPGDSSPEPAKSTTILDFRWALNWPKSLRPRQRSPPPSSPRSSHRPAHPSRQLKRTAQSVKRDNILLHMCRYDQPYIQLLSRFQSRTTYANVDNDVSVGFYTAGLVYTDFDRTQFLARARQTTLAKLHNASKLLWNRTLQFSGPVLNHHPDQHRYHDDDCHLPLPSRNGAEQPVVADDPVQVQVSPMSTDIAPTPPTLTTSPDAALSNPEAQASPSVDTVASRVSAGVQTGYRSLLQLFQSASLNRSESSAGWRDSTLLKDIGNGHGSQGSSDAPLPSADTEHGLTSMPPAVQPDFAVWHQTPIVHDEWVDTEQLVTRLIPRLAESYPPTTDNRAMATNLNGQRTQPSPTVDTPPPTELCDNGHTNQDYRRSDIDQKQQCSSTASRHHHHHRRRHHPMTNGSYPHWIAHLALGFHMPGLSWRKVHVYFATDAHNQIIARRRFYQRSGAPVIAHLLKHHPF
ncbi:hypothetical protein H4R34_001232 [Dimargaris verticillata]|uniref:DUF676 domain-containing protein n=1 Tax=Dimargaris verticillata TaxID=2761393 RepID=A0A9W8EEN6_9FUNG|nr:hypothetical protein H4R34_001232 [Dimargaris verticillata]